MATTIEPRKRHNYLVDYQVVPEDETETFVDFVDTLSMYDNVDRPKYGICDDRDSSTLFYVGVRYNIALQSFWKFPARKFPAIF